MDNKPPFIYWKNLIPGANPPENVYALIECPKGTRNKYEMSKSTNLMLLDRVLHSSVMYPHDYGFIPGTYADDGDPLDVMILITSPTFPKVLVDCKPIGVLIMEDEAGADEKILAVASNDPYYKTYHDVFDLPKHYLNEIEEFFRTYKNLEEPKYAEVKEWKNKEHAFELINEYIGKFKEKFGDTATVNPMA